MPFSFSVDSDFMFDKNAPCQLLRVNFKNKSDFFNYDFSFKLSAERAGSREKVTSSTYEFNFSLSEPR